jgi:uncharacterized protein YjiS (DUF1127 family)
VPQNQSKRLICNVNVTISAMRMLHGSIVQSDHCASAASGYLSTNGAAEQRDTPAATDRKYEADIMAYTNSTRAGNAALLDRLSAVVRSLRETMERRRLYNRTLRELKALSERELADLGLHAASIAEVAREAAYGK